MEKKKKKKNLKKEEALKNSQEAERSHNLVFRFQKTAEVESSDGLILKS